MQFDGMTPEQAAEEAISLRTQEAIDPQSDVREFMAAFGQPLPSRPQWPDDDTMDLRVRLKAEEFCEWLRDSGYEYSVSIQRVRWQDGIGDGTVDDLEAVDVFTDANDDCLTEPTEENRSLPKSADALIDDLYVTVGALAAMGIDMWPLWREVHRANMAKRGGLVIDGKVRKPEGWTPPDIDALLRKQGWEGE